MAKLPGQEIRERLSPLPKGTPPNYQDLILEGKPPQPLVDALTNGRIILDPFPTSDELDERIKSASLDIPIGHTFELSRMPFEVVRINGKLVVRRYTYDDRGVDHDFIENHFGIKPGSGPQKIRIRLSDDHSFELSPNMLLNVHSAEIVGIPHDLVAYINGRSRYARQGMTCHITSPLFDPGFVGYVVTETALAETDHGVMLYPGMMLASFEFETLTQPTAYPYYQIGTFSTRQNRQA